ncbi:GerAB/ArcD/ProY family transporter [Fervidibacillus halotolerans]|uniref:Endospore germination permease n=1 Tax=Fervidibacillus halotolerans TaxID=2980027 RepID=A0A9E8M023_9BACI|nr:endospore germination permease [Fervidibacillus halotolerans]WAA12711.1 endospore germination permease [Fervidibacillus halotolerans]
MNTKLTERQLRMLVILYVVGSSILFTPATLAQEAKQDAWIASLISVLIGLFIGYIILKLYKVFPNLTMIEIIEHLLGKWLGKIVGFTFFLFSFLLASLVLRNLGEFIITEILPETPILYVHILVLLAVIQGVRYGIHVIGRSAEILSFFFFFMYFFFVLFLTPQLRFENIQPIFDVGIKPIIRATLPYIGFPFLEVVIFLMVLNKANKNQQVDRSFLSGIVIGGLMISLITIISILVLGADLTERNNYPSYILGKKISIGKFIERIEALIAIIWMITIFVKLSILYYASAESLKQLFQFKRYEFLLFPLGMIIIVLAFIIYPNISYTYYFISRIWFFYSATFGFLLPVLLLIMIKWKKRQPNNKSPSS